MKKAIMNVAFAGLAALNAGAMEEGYVMINSNPAKPDKAVRVNVRDILELASRPSRIFGIADDFEQKERVRRIIENYTNSGRVHQPQGQSLLDDLIPKKSQRPYYKPDNTVDKGPHGRKAQRDSRYGINTRRPGNQNYNRLKNR